MNNLHTFVPPSFVCMLQTKVVGAAENIISEFMDETSQKPEITISNQADMVIIAASQGCHVASDSTRGLTAILHGELYMNAGANHAAFALQQLADQGESFAAKLNGSFVLLIISEHEPFVRIITDRLNSRRAFHSFDGNRHWISSSIHWHPTDSLPVNPVGIAHLLASGSMQNFHTPFEGVRVLEQASIHVFDHDGLHSSRYWTLHFERGENGSDECVLLDELADIVTESVRVRLFDDPCSWVSLSGGYDSRLITQLLANENADVRNFSYKISNAELNTESDGFLASEWSELLGQPHLFTNAYHGDQLQALQRNADLGLGMLNFCGEIDSWFELAKAFDPARTNAVFAGDTVFGFQWDIEIDCVEDALRTVHVYGIGELGPLKHVVPQHTWNTFSECLPDELQTIFNRVPKDVDLITAKDYLYIDQRLPNTILAWRTIVSDYFAPVRNPFVDNRLLDFIGRVPVSFRRDRGVYLQMIQKFYPQVTNFRRAKSSGCLQEWRKEYARFCDPLVDWLRTSDSKLDPLIPPDAIVRLLKDLGTWRHSPYSPRTLPSRLILKTIKGTKIGNRIQRRFPTAGMKHLLNRIIPLRAFLGTPIIRP
ncbi:Asparagine synthetase [glutamine-hydrolyzing] 3 [Novipirellula aureliae]|uniref:asparagine synthase (glutamine-hydrolyzing) n=1 Tax=Novipirellula aureliae TaxID=2527966 RepID=A0A5C6DJU1_9BACT|nr:asparagine synthase-related protein [Novipirellula aureliae]TWU37653.1 Asparagine synthetase [glutamine-hydrolyzing] 3 [Novipirellula aureliae]